MLETLASSGLGILLLGLMIGMQHALEADHVAAVSSIAARQSTIKKILVHGAFWGVGHTVTLMLVAGSAIAFGFTLNETLSNWLELIVGLMLVALGGNLIYLLIKERVHFHRHRHVDGISHFHAHSHRNENTAHNPQKHDHLHSGKLPFRSLFVGIMHGMAGSATLVVLTAATVHSVPLGLGYILLFGAGSVLGMGTLSALIAIPLAWSSKALTIANSGLQAGIGLATLMLGITVAVTSASALGN